MLTTILMATTVCTIYNAALFTNLAIQVHGAKCREFLTDYLDHFVSVMFVPKQIPVLSRQPLGNIAMRSQCVPPAKRPAIKPTL